MAAGDSKKQDGLQIEWRDGVYYLTGELNEFADFSPLFQAGSHLILNFRGVARVNSIGIRNLLRLVTLSPERLVDYAECPVSLISQINMIPALLGKKASPQRVLSFAVPFSCRACGTDFEVYLNTEDVVAELKKENEIVAPCPHCQKVVGLDMEDYFIFMDPLFE